MHQRLQTCPARIRQRLLWASAFVIFLCPSVGWAAHLCKAVPNPPGIDAELETRLGDAFRCFDQHTAGQEADSAEKCKNFVADSIQREWTLDHFWLEDKSRFMTVREMKSWLSIEGTLNGWEFLGTANEASVHAGAAERAGAGQPVVAVYHSGSTRGQVALVLPGDLQNSGTYGIPVARIAQTGLNNSTNSFLGCAFSYGLGNTKASEALIYAYRGQR